jgi:hypothetical protein
MLSGDASGTNDDLRLLLQQVQVMRGEKLTEK